MLDKNLDNTNNNLDKTTIYHNAITFNSNYVKKKTCLNFWKRLTYIKVALGPYQNFNNLYLPSKKNNFASPIINFINLFIILW